MPEPPEPYVQARMHGGPHDGEIVSMPWARVDVPVLGWDGDEPVVSMYRLAGPWRGQATAEYEFVEPETEEKAA